MYSIGMFCKTFNPRDRVVEIKMSQRASRISHERMDEPHVRGRRVSALQLYEQVETRGPDPAEVASQLAFNVLDVNAALQYYGEDPEEMAKVRVERRATAEKLGPEIASERPNDVSPQSWVAR